MPRCIGNFIGVVERSLKFLCSCVVVAMRYQHGERRFSRTGAMATFPPWISSPPVARPSMNLAHYTLRSQSKMSPEHSDLLFRTLSVVFFLKLRYADAGAHRTCVFEISKPKTSTNFVTESCPASPLRSGFLYRKDSDPGLHSHF